MHRNKKLFLFDQLICTSEQRRWDGDAYRLRGLDVDRQLVIRRRLDWHLCRLIAPEDAVNIAGGAPVPHAVERIAWAHAAMGAESFTDPRPGVRLSAG